MQWKPYSLSCWFLLPPFFLLSSPAPTLVEPFSAWYPYFREILPSFRYLFSAFLRLGRFLQTLLMTLVLKHQENFLLRWIWHFMFNFFPLSVLLLASLSPHVARLYCLLSSYDQAKMHMLKTMFFFSLKSSPLFSVMLQDGKRLFAIF